MTTKTIKIGTRGSPLALWQSEWVRDRLTELHDDLQIELIRISTKGDKILDAPLAQIGGDGLFTREIERALLDGEIDLAVHSLKDLPTTLPDGLVIGAVCEREDPRDALVTKGPGSLADLPERGVVATSSLRRKAQLLHQRADLEIVDVRGNVGTRLRKFDESDWDAMVMARAGLVRLGLDDRVACILEPADFLPAVSQGALGIETRLGDAAILEALAPLDHSPTRAATDAERAFLRRLSGGCQVPIGALALVDGGALRLDGAVASPDGQIYYRDAVEGAVDDAERLGEDLAERLIGLGADQVLDAIRGGQ